MLQRRALLLCTQLQLLARGSMPQQRKMHFCQVNIKTLVRLLKQETLIFENVTVPLSSSKQLYSISDQIAK